MKLISLDVDAPRMSFSVSDNLVNIGILILESIGSEQIQNPFHAFGMDVGEQKELFFIADKKRKLLNSDFSYGGGCYYHNKIFKNNICRLIFISSVIQGK